MSTAADRFTGAYVIGGSPCSGKSSVAERLSAAYGLRLYRVDDHQQAHLERCRPDRHPVMWRLAGMGWNEMWSRPVDAQVAEVFAFYRERFEMIVADLAQFDADEPLLIEGAACLPELVRERGVEVKRAVFMAPTPVFQVAHYRARPWIQGILAACDDPAQAFENWMLRDHRFGVEVLRQARAFGYETITVDGTVDVEGMVERVRGIFGLG